MRRLFKEKIYVHDIVYVCTWNTNSRKHQFNFTQGADDTYEKWFFREIMQFTTLFFLLLLLCVSIDNIDAKGRISSGRRGSSRKHSTTSKHKSFEGHSITKPAHNEGAFFSHQQEKAITSNFLRSEGGGRKRLDQQNILSTSSKASAPPFDHVSKFNTAGLNHHVSPYKPSAPVQNHFAKASAPSLESHAGQLPGNGNQLSHTNAPWSNPYYNANKPTGAQPIGNTHQTVPSYNHPVGNLPNGSPYVRQPAGAPYPTQPIGNTYHQNAPPYNPVPVNNPYPIQSGQIHGQSAGSPYAYPSVGSSYPTQMHGNAYHPQYTHPVGSPYFGQPNHAYGQPAAQPYAPGQTIVMVPGQQSSNDRGLGQVFKEALIYSGVNAAVNRIISPQHYHHHDYDSIRQSVPRPSDTSSVTTSNNTTNTQITYNNQYFNVPPPISESNGTIIGGNDATYQNIPVGNPVAHPSNVPSGNPVINQESTAIDPNRLRNTDSTVPVNQGNTLVNPSSTNVTSNGDSSNNQQNPIDNPNFTNGIQYRISNEELWKLTESLFEKDEYNAYASITLNLQGRVKGDDEIDQASGPLFSVKPEAYSIPTIRAIRSLYDNYEFNSQMREAVSTDERKEENLLLDIFLNTDVMATAMRWLADQNFIEREDYERKDTLRRIWFNQFDGSTSGFERVFVAESYEGTTILGVQDWIYFDYQESLKHIDYMGYVDKIDLGNKAALVKLNFRMNEIFRPNATIFIGTSPELEMALYTVCFFVRPNDICPVSLGGTKFNILTHTFRYFGKDLIDLAFPFN